MYDVRTYRSKRDYSSLCFLEGVIVRPCFLPAVLGFHGQLDHGFDSFESPHPSPGRIDRVVGVLNFVPFLVCYKEITNAPGFQSGKGVLLTPDAVYPI